MAAALVYTPVPHLAWTLATRLLDTVWGIEWTVHRWWWTSPLWWRWQPPRRRVQPPRTSAPYLSIDCCSSCCFWPCTVLAPRFAALRIVAPTPWYRCIPSLMPRWSAYCGFTIPLFLELPRRCELLVLTPAPNFAANFCLISNVCSGVNDGFVIRELNSKKVLNFVLFTVFDLPASAGSLRQPGMHAFSHFFISCFPFAPTNFSSRNEGAVTILLMILGLL